VTAERDVIEARKAKALRDLVEVERQREAGEIDAATADHLKRIYEAEIIAALEPEPGPPDPDAPRFDRMTSLLTLAGIVVVACVAIVAVIASRSDLDESGAVQSTVSTLPGGGRDLATVSNEEMEAVIEQNPSITAMRLALIERYLRDGDLEKAKEHSEIALENDPSPEDRQEALKYLGWTTALLGEPEEGATLLDEALLLDPVDQDARWFLANVKLSQLDDAEGAAALLRELLEEEMTDTQREAVEAKLADAESR
jgi:tetratricopeptide (TPR) repeat protein